MSSSSPTTRVKDFLRELKRRKVYRVGAVYAVVGLGVAQGADWLFGLIELADAELATQVVAVLVLLGFPVALVLAWAYELRPEEGGSSDPPSPGDLSSRADPARPGSDGASIVVLPFDNISPDPADAFLADGLTEEITASLSGVRDLRVTSRNSATVLKKQEKSTQAIGIELGVSFVLEGSVRKAGDALRVTAQLIRADTDEHLWSERYDGAMSDVFGVQEEVARSIVRTLELHLRPDEERRLAARPMDDLRAYESYLKAREVSLKWTREAQEHALELLLGARAQTGENAVIEAGIGYVYTQFANIGETDRDYFGLAEEHARRALELDPENPEAHMVLGFLLQFSDIERSVHHLRQSLAIKPDDSHALTWYILSLAVTGRNDELKEAADRLVTVDPLNPMSYGLRAMVRQIHGDLDGGHVDTEVWAEASPPGTPGRFFLAWSFALLERYDEALDLLRREFGSESRAGGFSTPPARLLKAALEKDPAGMDEILTDEVRSYVLQDLGMCYYVAAIFAFAERPSEASWFLAVAADRGFRNYTWIQHDPWIFRYREHPDFREVFEQIRTASKSLG